VDCSRRAGVAQVDDDRLADEALERELVEAGAAAELVQWRVDVRTGVAGEREHLELPAVLLVRRAEFDSNRRVGRAVGAAVEDGLREVDQPHGAGNVAGGRWWSNRAGDRADASTT